MTSIDCKMYCPLSEGFVMFEIELTRSFFVLFMEFPEKEIFTSSPLTTEKASPLHAPAIHLQMQYALSEVMSFCRRLVVLVTMVQTVSPPIAGSTMTLNMEVVGARATQRRTMDVLETIIALTRI